MEKSRKTIESVNRTLAILDLFERDTPELGITEIARRINLPKSTVAGLVYTLESWGYLVREPESRKYRLGLRLVERATVALSQFDVIQSASPHLEQLVTLHHKSVNLGILDGTEILCVDNISVYTPYRGTRIGLRLAVHATAMGKAILSALTPNHLDEVLTRLSFPRFTPRTILDRTALLNDLHLTRQRGFALDNAESAPGIGAIAAPIFNWRGQVLAAVSMAMPYPQFSPESQAQWSKDIRTTAAYISRSLGAVNR
jgi:DNA-binding IclR family transcriptional regulator